MGVRFWRVWTGLAAFGVAVALVPTGGSEVADAPSAYPGLYFIYSMNCTFSIENDAGSPVSSIPAGTYDTVVRTPVAFGAYPLVNPAPGDMTACRGLAQFQLTGPGVNLNTTVYGGCLTDEEYIETFQPNSTYTAQDNNQPAVTKTVLTTLAAGTPLATPQNSGSGGGQSSSSSMDIVGSAIHRIRGTLIGVLSADGSPTLAFDGRAVSTLKAGRYTFNITDRDASGAFTLQAPSHGSAIGLSGVSFVGTRVTTVTLKPGRWTYFSGAGNVHAFVVTG
jgi:hypothetical protein